MIKADHLIRRKDPSSNIDSVKERRAQLRDKHRDIPLLDRSRRCWNNFDDFRQNRARDLRFGYGDQLGDVIIVDGKPMTYREYLLSTGNFAIQTNQIKNKVDTVVGVMVKEHSQPVCHAVDPEEQQYGEVVTEALQGNCRKNRIDTLYKQWMKDALIGGGMWVGYETYDATSGPSRRLDSWSQYVNPHTFFMETAGVDPRIWDVSLIGRFFSLSKPEMVAKFVKTQEDYDILKQIYPEAFSVFPVDRSVEFNDKFEDGEIQWMASNDPTRCYICETWTRETRRMIRLWDTNAGKEEIIHEDDYEYRKLVKQENERRRKMGAASKWAAGEIPFITGDGYGKNAEERNGSFVEDYWYCKLLAPDGTVLWEGESPYPDGLHPFTVGVFPYTDGRIVSYLHDAVELNLAMNRSLILHDWLVRTQAKGVTVVPKSILPKGMSEKEFANSWASIEDLVFIDVKPGQEDLFPKTFFSPAQSFDVSNILATYSRLMETGTPVNGAIQGKAPGSGTSGVLYEQMVANSATPIAALMDSFHDFVEQFLIKKMKNITAFYDEQRFESIVGQLDGVFDNENMHLNEIKDIEFDLAVKEGSDTPVFREMMEQDLLAFLNAGFITFDEFLEESGRPYTDRILQKRQARQAEMQAAQEAGMVPMGTGGVSPAEQEAAAAMQQNPRPSGREALPDAIRQAEGMSNPINPQNAYGL